MITVDTKCNAWKLVNKLTGSAYCKENEASENAGYNIYRNEQNGICVCDLGTRFEINYVDGTTENIWIESKEKLSEVKPKNIKEKLTDKVCELIDKEEYDNIYKLLELMSDYKDIIE